MRCAVSFARRVSSRAAASRACAATVSRRVASACCATTALRRSASSASARLRSSARRVAATRAFASSSSPALRAFASATSACAFASAFVRASSSAAACSAASRRVVSSSRLRSAVCFARFASRRLLGNDPLLLGGIGRGLRRPRRVLGGLALRLGNQPLLLGLAATLGCQLCRVLGVLALLAGLDRGGLRLGPAARRIARGSLGLAALAGCIARRGLRDGTLLLDGRERRAGLIELFLRTQGRGLGGSLRASASSAAFRAVARRCSATRARPRAAGDRPPRGWTSVRGICGPLRRELRRCFAAARSCFAFATTSRATAASLGRRACARALSLGACAACALVERREALLRVAQHPIRFRPRGLGLLAIHRGCCPQPRPSAQPAARRLSRHRPRRARAAHRPSRSRPRHARRSLGLACRGIAPRRIRLGVLRRGIALRGVGFRLRPRDHIFVAAASARASASARFAAASRFAASASARGQPPHRLRPRPRDHIFVAAASARLPGIAPRGIGLALCGVRFDSCAARPRMLGVPPGGIGLPSCARRALRRGSPCEQPGIAPRLGRLGLRARRNVELLRRGCLVATASALIRAASRLAAWPRRAPARSGARLGLAARRLPGHRSCAGPPARRIRRRFAASVSRCAW
jgi:hypothetical protein